jgi:ABC-type transport system substrate-binding protein
MAQMLTEVGIRTNARLWDPGPAWNKFYQTDGKATNGVYVTWGNYSVFDADAVLHPLFHSEVGGWIGKWYTRVEGLDKLIDEGRSTLNKEQRKRTYSQIQKMIREEAPAVFLFTQYDTLAISKRVEYAARGDEWLWLFDARPKR